MPGPSPFADDWRDCLSAHYQFVVRNEDHVAARTLPGILHELGFSDSELAELAIRATMHIDDMPADYVPNVEAVAQAIRAAASAPDAAGAGAILEQAIAEIAQETAVSVEYDSSQLDELFEEEDDPPPTDGFKQMSLF